MMSSHDDAAHVLELPVHLQHCAELTAQDTAAVVEDAAPDAVHSPHFSPHGSSEDAVEAERTTRALVHTARQCTHKARETEVRIGTTAAVLETTTQPCRPLPDVLWLSLIFLTSRLIDDDNLLLLLLLRRVSSARVSTVPLLWLSLTNIH